MWKKITGTILILIGLSMLVFYPDWTAYQTEEMSKLGISLAFIIFSLGLFFLFY